MPTSTERIPHVFDDLPFTVAFAGEALHGEAAISATMCVPGTSTPHVSLAATWADYTLGALAVTALSPRMPVTLELDVHLFPEADGVSTLRWAGAVVKAGRSVIVTSLDFTDETGRRIGFAHGLFMAAPDPGLSGPARSTIEKSFVAERSALVEPFLSRVGCERRDSGTVALLSAPHVHNSSGAINGGLLTAVVEAAALSADGDTRPLESMQVRYLRGIRQGPAVARATIQNGVADVAVIDEHTGSLAVLATTRAAGRAG